MNINQEQIKFIEDNSKILADKVKLAQKNYEDFLLGLGYSWEVYEDYDIDTRYFMIHPLYLEQWKKGNWGYDLSWAVIEIGYFPEERE